tara:strand:+ start:3927 stop:4208 length:282 start_codon:yes stop_codon:yes gene_type:complete
MHPDLDPDEVEYFMNKVLKHLEDVGAVSGADQNIAASNVFAGKIMQDGLDDVKSILEENRVMLIQQMIYIRGELSRIADIHAEALQVARGRIN